MEYGVGYSDELEEKVYLEGIAAKESGQKVVGVYCAFTPKELIVAAGAIPVSLCAGSSEPIAKAEEHLPRAICPLIKASYGFARNGNCPYFNATDFLLADATCDGKKKMFELLNRIKPLHLLQLPQTYETEEALAYWLEELKQVGKHLEVQTGKAIDDGFLLETVKQFNRYRTALQSLYELNRRDVPLVSGRELLHITGANGFDIHLDDRIAELNAVRQNILARSEQPLWKNRYGNKPKILLTGCPTTNRKVIDALEDSGAVVVAMESCGGLKTVGDRVAETGDIWRNLATYYLKTACPCMSPNPKRLKILSDLIQGYQVDGVVEMVWQGCHAYNVEAFQVKEHVQGLHRKPYLQIETDYSQNDLGQIRLRIEAFLELIA